MILAGDVGGTKTLLEIGALQGGHWQPVYAARHAAADFPDLHAVLRRFLLDWEARAGAHAAITRACLGVAGPVVDNRAKLTNLPWTADAAAIGADFGIPSVHIVNDFAAAASGVALLQPADLVVLQAGEPLPQAPRLVLGAGTGLGVACMTWRDDHYEVISGEGGHTGFAPASLEQDELWRELFARQGRVTAEDVVSGPGLARIHAFLLRKSGRSSGTTGAADLSPAAVVQGALESGDEICLRALDLFIACYGEVAGNYALAILARGGVFIAGGIAPRILARLARGGFLAAFNAKGVHAGVAQKMPVSIVTHERLGLLGAALIASRLPGQ